LQVGINGCIYIFDVVFISHKLLFFRTQLTMDKRRTSTCRSQVIV